MIVLDTHVLVWLAAGDRRLGRRASGRIDAALRGEGAGVSAIVAARLRAFHGDPADRLIAATALELGSVLVTADERLLGWRGGVKVVDATK